MDLKKAKTLLGKINTLFQSLDSDDGSIAPIEKDLMRSYLRELYEQFHDVARVVEVKEPPAPEPKKQEEIEVIRMEKKAPPPPPPPPPPRPKPRIVEPPKMDSEPEPAKPAPAKPEVPVVQPVAKSKVDPDVLELFEMPNKAAKELSEKLSEMPISDLTKAMGLNERIFTINELYGGNQDAFEQSIQELNKYSSFNEAKKYLYGLAQTYNWAEKAKAKKAKNYIKLIRRRYV
jgi:hypothetical protein